MTPQKLRGLQAEILADEECKPFVVTADEEKTDAIERDRAIPAIRNDKRPPRLRPHMISERGVRASLSILEGAALIRTLRDLSAATDMPKWLSDVLAAVHVPAEMQWAYFDTMQCGYSWLRGDGLDLGSKATRDMLGLIAAGVPALGLAVAKLSALAEEPDTITADEVSRALRGPWGDEPTT